MAQIHKKNDWIHPHDKDERRVWRNPSTVSSHLVLVLYNVRSLLCIHSNDRTENRCFPFQDLGWGFGKNLRYRRWYLSGGGITVPLFFVSIRFRECVLLGNFIQKNELCFFRFESSPLSHNLIAKTMSKFDKNTKLLFGFSNNKIIQFVRHSFHLEITECFPNHILTKGHDPYKNITSSLLKFLNKTQSGILLDWPKWSFLV